MAETKQFVIQKHDASQLHYDFRLEMGGALASWAVPKGLSTAANEKRLAIRVEDHELDYADFEGVIPEGEYGAGTVMIWDRGTYEPLIDGDDETKRMEEAREDGSLKFRLNGEKLQGGYAMARTGERDGQEQWVIFKLDDAEADARRKPTRTETDSVETGRSLDEIEEDEGEQIEVSHPDKVLFPESGVTKRDLADYYRRIADRLLKHVEGRPLTLRCFPDGIVEDGFFNKNAPEHFPDFIERIQVPTRDKDKAEAEMSSADQAADLVYFAGQNAIELHAALSRKGGLERPDQVIFDLDPSEDDFAKVREVAITFHELLDSLEIPVFWKTTGSRGLHAHIPLRPEKDFDAVRGWAKALAERLRDRLPERATLESRKDRRGDKVFIDYLRNAYGQTSIVPYGVRAREGAPVATPIRADELRDGALTPDRYTIKNLFRRLARIDDPWANFKRRRLRSLESKL